MRNQCAIPREALKNKNGDKNKNKYKNIKGKLILKGCKKVQWVWAGDRKRLKSYNRSDL